MEEMIEILKEIRDGIYSMNENIGDLKDSIDELKGNGLYNSITDVCDKLELVASDIKGNGLYDSLSDVCDKLSDISSSLNTID